MKNLAYLLVLLLILPSCIKDEDEAPDTSNLPKRIKTAILSEYNVESQRIDYYYSYDKVIKAERYAKSSTTGEWEMVNELNYEYDLPNVTLTINYNLLGTWTTTAKVEYVIEEGKIIEMNDYTNFYDTWRHDVSTSYVYTNSLLDSYIQETLSQDTVSYATKWDYTYSGDNPIEATKYYLVNGNWIMNEYLSWGIGLGDTEDYMIFGFDADSIASSEIRVSMTGNKITKKETSLADIAGGAIELFKTETFTYFQDEYLLYSDEQTEFQFQHVDYYYENAEGNISWFDNPQDELEASPRPKANDIVKQVIKLAEKGRP